MGVYSFPSIAISDSTVFGRSWIQVADQAAAQGLLGVNPANYGLLDSDNTWAGDNSFSETLDAATAILTNSTISNLHRSAGGDARFFVEGADGDTNASWIAIEENAIVWKRTGSASVPNDLTVGFEFATQPRLIFDGLNTTLTVNLFNSNRVQFTTSGTVFSSGIKFSADNIYSVGEPSARVAAINSFNGNFRTVNVEADGTFNFYKLGQAGATNREYFEWKYAPLAGAWHMRPKKAGTGNFQDFCLLASRYQNTFIAFRSGGASLGIGFGDETVQGNDNITITTSQTMFGENCVPTSAAISANKTFGSASQRWPIIYSSLVDTFHGSFSTNLRVESTGVFKLYGSGTDGDPDTTYIQAASISGSMYLGSYKTGSSTAEDFYFQFDGSNRLALLSSEIKFYRDAIPSVSNSYQLGKTFARFSNVLSVLGDFSSDVTVGGVINQMTSSTSDPTTSDYANDGDFGIHKNTTSGTLYIACNSSGTIYKQALGGAPPP